MRKKGGGSGGGGTSLKIGKVDVSALGGTEEGAATHKGGEDEGGLWVCVEGAGGGRAQVTGFKSTGVYGAHAQRSGRGVRL